MKGITEDEREIQEVVDTYLKAMETGNLDLWRQSFYPDCAVINAGDGSSTPIMEYANFIKEQHEKGVHVLEIPRSRGISVVGRIANVRMEWRFELGDDVFHGTTFFNLVKYGETWKVTQKIYYIMP